MYLASLAHASPEKSWTQAECWAAFRDSPVAQALRPRSRDLVERVLLGNSGIETRSFCTPRLDLLLDRSAQDLNHAFEREAPSLGARALRLALERANLPLAGLDALFVCTCTGYLCPGVASHIGEQAGLRPDAYHLDLTGAGCGAAIPALRAAQNYLAAHPGHRAAVVAVEVCSAAFYVDDDPGVLISLCLFGDGAAAAILDDRGPGPSFSDFRSLHLPAEREKIRFVNREGKLRNQLHRTVPELAAAAVAQLFPAGQTNGHTPHVVSHGGGKEVLAAIRARLPGHDLAEATEVLRQHGNMSSPSVLFALEQALAAQNGAPPKPRWLVSFGAGFSCHSCQLA